MNKLLLDFDGPMPKDIWERIGAVFRWMGGRPAVVEVTPSKHGWHVVIHTRARWAVSPVVIVAAQAILGSDPLRELFNLMRAVSLKNRPKFWRQRHRWNVHYRRKITGG